MHCKVCNKEAVDHTDEELKRCYYSSILMIPHEDVA